MPRRSDPDTNRFDAEPPVDERPVYVTRRSMLTMGAIIGGVLAVMIIAFVLAVISLSDSLEGEINSRVRTDDEIEKIAKQFQPSPEQIKKNLIDAVTRCAKIPACRRGLADAVRAGRDDSAAKGSSTTNPGRDSSNPVNAREMGNNTDAKRDTPPATIRHKRPSDSERDTQPVDGGDGGASPTPTPAPTATPEPMADIHVPLVPPTCIGQVVHINCD